MLRAESKKKKKYEKLCRTILSGTQMCGWARNLFTPYKIPWALCGIFHFCLHFNYQLENPIRKYLLRLGVGKTQTFKI